MSFETLRTLLEEPKEPAAVVTEEVGDSLSSLERWHALFNKRLKQQYPNESADQITRKLLPLVQARLKDTEANHYGLAEQLVGDAALKEVKAWVVGKDVPRDIYTHRALMDVLNLQVHHKRFLFSDGDLAIIKVIKDEQLSKTKLKERFGDRGIQVWARWKQVDGTVQRVADYRLAMTESHAKACSEMEKIPRHLIACNGIHHNSVIGKGSLSISGEGSVGSEVIKDHEFLPKRVVVSKYQGDLKTYETLSKPELLGILNHTKNACEFLKAWRYLQESEGNGTHLSLTSAAERLGYKVSIEYAHMESGERIPYGSVIEKASRLFKKDAITRLENGRSPKDQFIALVIENRLAAYHHYMDKGDTHRAAQYLLGMPHAYWAEMFYKVNGNRDKNDSIPEWSDAVPTITTKGEYLRAARYITGLTQQQTAEKILQEGEKLKNIHRWIGDVEHDESARNTLTKEGHEALRGRLADFYEQCYKEGTNRSAWFQRKVFNQMKDPEPYRTPTALQRLSERGRRVNEGSPERD